MNDDRAWTEAHLRRIARDYQSLSSPTVAVLSHTPSAVEFGRFVGANRPVIIRRQHNDAGSEMAVVDRWSNEYLLQQMGDRQIEIAVSYGDADSVIVDDELHGEVFVEPASVSMSMQKFFDLLSSPQESKQEQHQPEVSSSLRRPVYYLQSQNGNLLSELEALGHDVDSPKFARDAFGKEPELPNLWIGTSDSITSTHKDPFENIYLVVRGTKTFHLQPPTEFYCQHERRFPHTQYSFDSDTNLLSIKPVSDPLTTIPWIPVDPSSPDLTKYPRFKYARPIIATLQAGDMLYLPALWYHRVSQQVAADPGGGELPLAIAVNWWFEMDYDTPLHSFSTSLRRMTLSLDGVVEVDDDDDDDDGPEQDSNVSPFLVATSNSNST